MSSYNSASSSSLSCLAASVNRLSLCTLARSNTGHGGALRMRMRGTTTVSVSPVAWITGSTSKVAPFWFLWLKHCGRSWFSFLFISCCCLKICADECPSLFFIHCGGSWLSFFLNVFRLWNGDMPRISFSFNFCQN